MFFLLLKILKNIETFKKKWLQASRDTRLLSRDARHHFLKFNIFKIFLKVSMRYFKFSIIDHES